MSRSHINMMTSHISCGVLEVGSLLPVDTNNAWEVANRFYHPANGSPEAFVMASDTDDSASSRFMRWMRDKKYFSSLFISMPAINPKSGSTIAVFCGEIDHTEFKKWYLEESVRRLQRRVGA